MGYKYNVSCSETLNKKWTPAAIDCYSNGCTCSKCYLNKVFFSKRNMQETVIELVRKIGQPKLEENDIL